MAEEAKRVCQTNPKCWEITCFVFAISFVFAAFYYLSHSVDTAAAWLITSVVTFLYAFVVRIERLESDEYPFVKQKATLRSTQALVVAFLFWAIVNVTLAISNVDGIEPESKWMTFIASMMGLKWSTILARNLMRLQAVNTDSSTVSRRALLSPIGEIA